MYQNPQSNVFLSVTFSELKYFINIHEKTYEDIEVSTNSGYRSV